MRWEGGGTWRAKRWWRVADVFVAVAVAGVAGVKGVKDTCIGDGGGEAVDADFWELFTSLGKLVHLYAGEGGDVGIVPEIGDFSEIVGLGIGLVTPVTEIAPELTIAEAIELCGKG